MRLDIALFMFSGAVIAAHGAAALGFGVPSVRVCLGLAVVLLFIPRAFMLGIFFVGLGFAAWHLQPSSHPDCQGDVRFVGTVDGLPKRGEGYRGFIARAEDGPCAPGRVRLSWYEERVIRAGERYRFEARLKPARGLANEAGFDAERWFRANDIHASGYVSHAEAAGVGMDAPGPVDGLRERLRDEVDALPLVHGDVIKALTIGDDSDIEKTDHERYRRTGTVHLLVISGLHVGVVTLLGFLLGRALSFLLPVHPSRLGAGFALLFGGAYVLVAGAGLPLVRAFIMSVVAMAGILAARRVRSSTLLSIALIGVLLWDPMAPLDGGFWLSFGAVALLIAFFSPRYGPHRATLDAVRAQWVVAVAFAPIVAVVIGAVQVVGFAVNLVAVPLVTLFSVPCALLGVALIDTPLGHPVLVAADFSLALLHQLLGWVEGIDPPPVTQRPLRLFMALVLAAVWLLPLGRAAAALVVVTMAALLLLPSPVQKVANGRFAITVLDVGQGLSIIVTTHDHVLVYDTGPAFPSGNDTAQTVLLPVLRARGVSRVDVLVVSHHDIDHAGGVASLRAGMEVGHVIADADSQGLVDGAMERCRGGRTWTWDGVHFEMLHPPPALETLGDNNRSCVLLVTDAQGVRALLPGDIEAQGEDALLRSLPVRSPPVRAMGIDAGHGARSDAGNVNTERTGASAVELLVMPHHGSKTSSTHAFLDRLRPAVAIASAGYRNHFNHPHPLVVERYRNIGSHVVSTAASGALHWHSAKPGTVRGERCRRAPEWRQGRLSYPCVGARAVVDSLARTISH